ncbi:alpha/beta fold hydrolase [Sphingomicrobium flavum]|uniref:alpha/beta fold hydrolase n=1 Tax=Sphingomicrobium flavum TaxID=1229164 RepID=UPI0021AE1BA9|nr:alpha/beta fold hydrolase [Sphingomicrobium flavum]
MRGVKQDADFNPAGLPEVDADHLAPSGWHRTRELAWQFPRMFARLGHLQPRGPETGPPAMVIPGFLSTDRSTMDLRRALARAGWRAHCWGLGMNRGAKPDTLVRIGERLEALNDGRGVLLLGWSLGGLFARAASRHHHRHVRAVVTLASPFSGDLKTNTNVRWLYERVAGHDVNQPPFGRGEGKPPVPTLAFWSRRDGIVAPSAARGLEHEVDLSVELDTHHMGMVIYRPALSHVCHHIRRFVEHHEGACPIKR